MLLSGQVSGQQAKEEVAQLVRGLGAVLEEKRASLLQAIEECQQERLARLGAQIREHRGLLDGSGLLGYAQEVLKETDQPCFVQAAKQLHNRYPGRRGAASVGDGARGHPTDICRGAAGLGMVCGLLSHGQTRVQPVSGRVCEGPPHRQLQGCSRCQGWCVRGLPMTDAEVQPVLERGCPTDSHKSAAGVGDSVQGASPRTDAGVQPMRGWCVRGRPTDRCRGAASVQMVLEGPPHRQMGPQALHRTRPTWHPACLQGGRGSRPR